MVSVQTCNGLDRRIHGFDGRLRGDFTWYGSNRQSRPRGSLGLSIVVGVIKEDSGGVNSADPSQILFYGMQPNGNMQNGSWWEHVHLLQVGVPKELDGLDGVIDGHVTYRGYTDRNGAIVQGCTIASVDCVPLVMENLHTGAVSGVPYAYQFRRDANGLKVIDYDIKGPTGESLIEYPN